MNGQRVDCAEALRWFRLSAEQGNARAAMLLGQLYADLDPYDVMENQAESLRWYRLAAEQHNWSAQRSLGDAYRFGRGVPADPVLAHMWFNLAASNQSAEDLRFTLEEALPIVRETFGDDIPPSILAASSGPAAMRDYLAEDMTPDQVAEAQRLAREWDAAHPRDP